MFAGDQIVRTFPTTNVSPEEKLLRIKLMMSELSETIDAIAANDIVKIADGIADLIYVVKGTAITYGIDIEPIFNEVHKSNMSKCIDGKLIKDSSGKVLKPDSYSPPDIELLIEQQVPMRG
jgi:predicted HAD superfamily Cof-like phosphohydrolase